MAIQGVKYGLNYRNPSARVEVKLEGDWVKYRQLINNLDPLIATGAVAGQREASYRYFNALRQNINNGGVRFGYPKLGAKYLKKKLRMGGFSKMFNWTRSFYNAIEVRFKNFTYSVGIPRNRFKRSNRPGLSNDIPIDQYANILEHGNYKMGVVKRPIFRDTFKQIGGTVFVRAMIVKNINKRFIFRGIKPNIQ